MSGYAGQHEETGELSKSSATGTRTIPIDALKVLVKQALGEPLRVGARPKVPCKASAQFIVDAFEQGWKIEFGLLTSPIHYDELLGLAWKAQEAIDPRGFSILGLANDSLGLPPPFEAQNQRCVPSQKSI